MTTQDVLNSFEINAFVDSDSPAKFLRDPFGLVSGYHAYLVFSSLSERTDKELAGLGLSRADIARHAVEVVFRSRDAA